MTKKILASLVCLHRDESGQGLIEYVLILALIAFAAVGAMGPLATKLNSAFASITTKLGQYIS